MTDHSIKAPVSVERRGRVAHVLLNRPKALNALDFAMMDALVQVTSDLAADDSLAVVVIGGVGKHFMAGGDIHAFAGELQHAPDARQRMFTDVVDRVNGAIDNIARMPHPVVARVQGAVAGFGLSLMNACDLVVASEDTYFAAGYRNIALTPDGGGSWTLPRLVGARKAAEILLLGERFDVHAAATLGLVNRVVPLDGLDAAVDAMVTLLVNGPTGALRATKRLLRQGETRSLTEQLHAEALSFGRCTADANFVEGITAFTSKRLPRFHH